VCVRRSVPLPPLLTIAIQIDLCVPQTASLDLPEPDGTKKFVLASVACKGCKGQRWRAHRLGRAGPTTPRTPSRDQGFRSTTVMALTDEVEDASPGNGNATGTGESCGWRPL
jgi:hypothetical protein